GHDSGAESQWREWSGLIDPWRKFELLLAPGNHDIWSEPSAALYRRYAGRDLHYSYDRGPVHITVLDNSRSDALPPAEIAFLESDLKAHEAQPVKIVVSHRPAWLFEVLAKNADDPLHRLAKKYGVRYVIAGHVHELLHFSFDGVEYISVMSSGGHLRGSRRYEDGWFYGYATLDAAKEQTTFRIHELKAPLGQGRETTLDQWLGVGARR
ncbi:MAG TPA: metallophosphoesterase, partial [Bryobacteraceae bacterium]|nr:metallophosphoesterase [Bryobacteraceae bacterium]